MGIFTGFFHGFRMIFPLKTPPSLVAFPQPATGAQGPARSGRAEAGGEEVSSCFDGEWPKDIGIYITHRQRERDIYILVLFTVT